MCVCWEKLLYTTYCLNLYVIIESLVFANK